MTNNSLVPSAGIIIPGEYRSFMDDDDDIGVRSGKSPAGVRITSENAVECVAVMACIRVLGESLASLPLHIYQRMPDGGKEVATANPMYRLLHATPNNWQTSFEWRETMIIHLCLYGNAYCEVIRGDRDIVTELIPLHPSRMKVERLDNGSLRYTYTEPGARGSKASVTTYTQDQILHVRWMSTDSISGLVPVELSREAIALARACEIHGARYFGGGARPGIVLETEQNVTEETARLIKELWDKAHRGPWNAHKTAILMGGLKANELGGNNADSQFLESRRYQTEEICRCFRVPPHMIMDLSRSTFSNIEHQGIDFVTHTLMPWCRRFESAFTRDLITDPSLFVEFDVRGLLRGDAAARSSYYQTMWNLGVLSTNEIRSYENMNPVEGGDVRFIPMNMAPLGQAAAAPAIAAPDATQGGQTDLLPAPGPATENPEPEAQPRSEHAAGGFTEGQRVYWAGGEGSIEHIMTEGVLGAAGSQYAIVATPEDPVASIRVYKQGEPTAFSVGKRLSELSETPLRSRSRKRKPKQSL